MWYLSGHGAQHLKVLISCQLLSLLLYVAVYPGLSLEQGFQKMDPEGQREHCQGKLASFPGFALMNPWLRA